MSILGPAVAAHKALCQRIKEMFPEETQESLADTIEGATELDAAILSVLRAACEREAHAEALEQLMGEMSARQHRLRQGAQRLKRAALDAMLEVGTKKLVGPDMTASVRDGQPHVLVLNPEMVPDQFVRLERKPVKSLIAEALKSGGHVPGTSLSNPMPTIAIRRV